MSAPHRRRPLDAGRPRRAGAVAPAAAAVVLAALLVLLAGCRGEDAGSPGTTAPPPPTESTTTTEVPLEKGTQLTSYNPSVDDCFDKRKVGQPGKQTDIVLKLDCALPHSFEVFAVVDWPPPNWNDPDPRSRAYPGDAALRSFAKTECVKAFFGYVGQRYELSRLEMGFVLPPESTWPSVRRIGCYLYDPNEQKLQGSQRDSGA